MKTLLKTDIDIDFLDRNHALEKLDYITGALKDGSKHQTGVYFQNIPVDPFTNIASLDYETAENLGYFKMDFINNAQPYEGITDNNHLQKLLDTEPVWELFEYEDVVAQLVHVHEHFDIVKKIKPICVEDLAVILALIRPNGRKLLNKTRKEIDEEIWNDPKDGSYFFKRSHSVAFALSIVVQLNRMVESNAFDGSNE